MIFIIVCFWFRIKLHYIKYYYAFNFAEVVSRKNDFVFHWWYYCLKLSNDFVFHWFYLSLILYLTSLDIDELCYLRGERFPWFIFGDVPRCPMDRTPESRCRWSGIVVRWLMLTVALVGTDPDVTGSSTAGIYIPTLLRTWYRCIRGWAYAIPSCLLAHFV